MIMRKKNKTAVSGRSARLRGSGLFDVALALIVMIGLFGYVTNLMIQIKKRQDETLIASELNMISTASRAYVQQDYSEIMQDLYIKTASGDAVEIVPMSTLKAKGFLPESFTGSGIINAKFKQSFYLYIRAVNRASTTPPRPSMTRTDFEMGTSGGINSLLTDGNSANGEADIEAILVTRDGTAIPAADAGHVIALSDDPYLGFISKKDMTSGAYGSFDFNISGFASLGANYPGIGHFASLIALSNFGTLGVPDGPESALVDPFHRCQDMGASAEYADCLKNNDVYNNLVFHPYDSDNNGTIDTYPALRGLSSVSCASTGASGSANTFKIDCSQTDVTGNLSVAGNASVASDIDVGGNASVDGDISVSGTTTLTGSLQANNRDNKVGPLSTSNANLAYDGRTIMTAKNVDCLWRNVVYPQVLVYGDLNGGQDLAEGIYDSRVVRAQSSVQKPSCPAHNVDGYAMEPRIYVTPAAYSDANGRPIVGVRAYAEDLGTQWRVHLLSFVGRDYCSNSVANPLSDTGAAKANSPEYVPNVANCSTFNADGSVATSQSDSKSDVYEVGPNFGAILVQTRCY